MRPLRDDPVGGYPKSYARDGIPKIDRYPGGQSAPTPKHIDFKPGELLGSVSGELGLHKFLEGLGHAFVVTSDKEGPTSVFERELPDAEVVISQPFWPAYLTVERIGKAKKLKLAITAGIGSDHVDLEAAIKNGVTVAEVTYSNSISVSEHVVMMILSLIRNYIPSHQWVINGGSNIADCVSRSYDLEAIEVGTVAAGRIGLAVLKRLKPVRRQASLHGSASACGRSREGARPHLPTERRLYGACLRGGYNQRSTAPGDFNEALIGKMNRNAYLVNTARGKFCEPSSVHLKEGSLPAMQATSGSRSHHRRITLGVTMPYHRMTPHTSGTSLSPRLDTRLEPEKRAGPEICTGR
jgi:formate dehydrogenase